MPEKAEVPAGVAAGTYPTTVTYAVCKLICQIGQGALPDPPVYKLLMPSPVSPSIARGIVTRVVKVAFCRTWGGPATAAEPRPMAKGNRKAANQLTFIVYSPVVIVV